LPLDEFNDDVLPSCTLFHYAHLTAQLSVPKESHTSSPSQPIQRYRYSMEYLPRCQRSVRPNALHITFWSFYDLSISLIVLAEGPSLELVVRTGRQDVWMRSGVVLPSEVCSKERVTNTL